MAIAFSLGVDVVQSFERFPGRPTQSPTGAYILGSELVPGRPQTVASHRCSLGSMVSKDEILAEIRRCAAENDGRPLGRDQFARETGIRETDWAGKYWIRWSDVVREAGFSPNERQSQIHADKDLLRLIADLSLELGHFPIRYEMRMHKRSHPEFPNESVIARRIGARPELLLAVQEFSLNSEGYTEVAEMCAVELRKLPGESPVKDGNSEGGYVYMIRMDKWHKIGKATNVLKRTGELRIALPARETLIHTIETDDPYGVENYWHRRFADRQTNGEWFLLTPEDVRAFKKWRRIS